jgi:hypothetical protein
MNADENAAIPMIVVPGNTETVAVIEYALQNPGHYLLKRHRDLVGGERLASAVALALIWHTEGLGLGEANEELIALLTKEAREGDEAVTANARVRSLCESAKAGGRVGVIRVDYILRALAGEGS